MKFEFKLNFIKSFQKYLRKKLTEKKIFIYKCYFLTLI